MDQQGTHSYSYDNLYRLTSVTYPGPAATSYAFDAFGNRTSKTDAGGATAYAYDNANRLSSVTDWNSNTTSYAYDDANRMTTTTLPSGTATSRLGAATASPGTTKTA